MAHTDSYKVRRFRDRWVWLILGIILFFVSWFIIFTSEAHAHGLIHALDPSGIVIAAGDDPVLDAVKTSGPAAGLVVALGYFLRTWQAAIRADIDKLQTKLDHASGVDGALKVDIATLQGAMQTLRAENFALHQRVDRLERRHSGSHRSHHDPGESR